MWRSLIDATACLALAGVCANCTEPPGKPGASGQASKVKHAQPSAPPLPKPPPPKTTNDVLRSGVLIVISKPSQQMHVFANNNLWRSSPISTGKQGKETPAGVFAILQKREFHRSNLYSNAPMPFMQRLTWDGIAIHAGHVPGYPASHGCIRLPAEFAKELFQLTGFTTTGVIVSDQAIDTSQDAYRLATQTAATIPIDPAVLDPKWAEEIRLAEADRVKLARPAPPDLANAAEPGGPAIQLAAAASAAQAEAHWVAIARQHPELAAMRKEIVPAVVDGQKFYRLRAYAKDAHERCSNLQRAGTACFVVT